MSGLGVKRRPRQADHLAARTSFADIGRRIGIGAERAFRDYRNALAKLGTRGLAKWLARERRSERRRSDARP